jgi:amino acid transporter
MKEYMKSVLTKANKSAFITGWSYYLGNIIAISANNVTVGKRKRKERVSKE